LPVSLAFLLFSILIIASEVASQPPLAGLFSQGINPSLGFGQQRPNAEFAIQGDDFPALPGGKSVKVACIRHCLWCGAHMDAVAL
jgi:hypothetical protein